MFYQRNIWFSAIFAKTSKFFYDKIMINGGIPLPTGN